MPSILTITLNPSLDKFTTIKSLLPEVKMHCTQSILTPGGGGINVSRALKELGTESLALYTSGGFMGKQLEQLVQEAGLNGIVYPIAQETRENLIVVETEQNKQYRFGMPGPELTGDEWQKVLGYVEKNNGFDIVVASGSLPKGVPLDFFGRLAAIVKQKKAKLIVDTSGEALKHALVEGVFLIKPNLQELASLVGQETLKEDGVVEAAQQIISTHGECCFVAVSMGASGAYLVSKDKSWRVETPQVEVRSTVGAGDSMVAGLVMGLQKGLDYEDVLKMGVACGTAATMNEGASLFKSADVNYIYNHLG